MVSDNFAVNVVSETQVEMSKIFATSLVDKWTNVDDETWDSDCPIIHGAIASFECATRLRYDGGA